MKRASLILSLLFISLPGIAQNDFSDVEIETKQVAGRVYMLTGAGGNLGASIGEDGIILIDDQFAPLAPRIRAALSEISESDVLYVLNTHWHGDHTGGNEFFGDIAPVVSHHNVRKRLAEGMDLPDHKIEPAPVEALPVLTFDSDLSLHFNGEEIRAIHLPAGHTDGDIVVWFPESNVIHMGDHLFQGRFPYIDLDSGGSVEGVIRNIEKVIGMVPKDVKVIPGHGDLTDLEGLTQALEMLKETSAIVRKALDEGKSLEQMQEEKILAKWEDFSWRFIPTERYLATLVRDFSSE